MRALRPGCDGRLKLGQTYASSHTRRATQLSVRQLAVLASNALAVRAPGEGLVGYAVRRKLSAKSGIHARNDKVAPFNSLDRFSSKRRIVRAFLGAKPS